MNSFNSVLHAHTLRNLYIFFYNTHIYYECQIKSIKSNLIMSVQHNIEQKREVFGMNKQLKIQN